MKISRSFWKQLITILALGAGIALSGSTSASAQLTATMDVSARVVAICSVATVVDMSFGAIDGMSAANPTAQGSLSLNCGAGIDVWIGIDDGVGNDRTMDDGSGNLLAYDICKDIACATTWGNTAGTGLDYTGVGGPEAVQVYGQIANANVLLAPAGVYGDTVNVAVNYY